MKFHSPRPLIISLFFSFFLTSLWSSYDGQFSPLAWPFFSWFLWLNFCLLLYLGIATLNSLSNNQLALLMTDFKVYKLCDDFPSLPTSYSPLIDIHYFMSFICHLMTSKYTAQLHISLEKFKIRYSTFLLTILPNYIMSFSYLTYQQ